jgi:hypothetical protein
MISFLIFCINLNYKIFTKLFKHIIFNYLDKEKQFY